MEIPNEIDEDTARALLLKAIRTRAATDDLNALGDILRALEDFDLLLASGDWNGMAKEAVWLLGRAEGS